MVCQSLARLETLTDLMEPGRLNFKEPETESRSTASDSIDESIQDATDSEDSFQTEGEAETVPDETSQEGNPVDATE